MTARAIFCCLVAALCIPPSASFTQSKSAVTPIEKVLAMMDDMIKKGTEEMRKEQVLFAAFSQWCKARIGVKTKEIETGNIEIDELSADIGAHKSKIRHHKNQISLLNLAIAKDEKDIKDAKDIRNKEEDDYVLALKDYEESIYALDKAIEILSKRDHDLAQASLVQSLLQVHALHAMPAATKKAITSYLQLHVEQPASLSYEAPEAKGYEFQSEGVLEMLRKLRDDFSNKKHEAMSEEMKAQHAFEDLLQQKSNEIEASKAHKGSATGKKAQREKLLADDQGDKLAVVSDRDEDAAYMADVKSMCKKKTEEFESRQELRKGELEAIKKAIEIISSKSVKGTGEKHLPALIQIPRGRSTSLVQHKVLETNPIQGKLAAFLEGRARASGSQLLMKMSHLVAEDPLKTVKKMIKDLEFKLRNEAAEETEHHGFCQAELGKNKITREARSADVAALNDKIEELETDISQLAARIAELKAAVTELDTAMGEAATDRTEAKAENMNTIKEAKEAQTAVEAAIAVLKDFYAKSAQATAFEQESRALDDAAPPPTFDKPYKGMLPEGGNIVDFLQVILSDFQRLEEETSSGEDEDQQSFEKFTFDSKKDKAMKETEIKMKSAKRTETETALKSSEKELTMTQDQLDKAIATYDKLKPQCVDSGINYDDRVKQREEEILSLQDALNILSGQDIA